MRPIFLALLPTLLFSAASLKAQSPLSVGINLVDGLDGLKAVTGKASGFTLDFGYQGLIGSTGLPFRASLAYLAFPGSNSVDIHDLLSDNGSQSTTWKPVTKTGVNRDLTDLQLACDVYMNTGVEHLSLVTGLSVNKWHTNNEWLNLGRAEDGTPHSNGPQLKLGFRAGLAYEVSKNYTIQVRYQFAALGYLFSIDDRPQANVTPGSLVADQRMNPSWIDFGVTYRF